MGKSVIYVIVIKVSKRDIQCKKYAGWRTWVLVKVKHTHTCGNGCLWAKKGNLRSRHTTKTPYNQFSLQIPNKSLH